VSGDLKIIRVTTWLDFGGVEKRFVNLSSSQTTNELVFVALGHGGWAEREIKKNGRRVICLRQNPAIPNVKLIWDLAYLFRKERPSVVHTSGAEANFHGLIAARMAGVPVRIGEEIGFPKHGRAFRMIFKFTYLCAHTVIGISKSVVARITEIGEVPKKKAMVVYNPLPTIKETVGFRSPGPIRIITVCRLFAIKNLDGLIKLLPEILRSRDITLQIIGEGPERPALEKLTADLGLTGIVEFCGFRENPIPFLVKADMFILPSFSEGLSNSLLEAMAVGLPCVVTREGGPSELIEDGKTGWLIDPFDPTAMLKAINFVLALPDKTRAAVGRNARNYVGQKFSLEHHESRLFQLYAKHLNEQKKN
jgi:Glycosyltransferase